MVLKLNTIEQYEAMLKENNKVFILKHSNTCPISMSAYDQFDNFLYERDMDGYVVIVQDARALSNYIEESTGIQHESPQALYYIDGKVVWHTSHSNITISNLSKAEE